MGKKHTPKRDWTALAGAVRRMGIDKLGEEDWGILLEVSRDHIEQIGLRIDDDRGVFLFALGVFLGAFNMRELPLVKAEIAANREIEDRFVCQPTETV